MRSCVISLVILGICTTAQAGFLKKALGCLIGARGDSSTRLARAEEIRGEIEKIDPNKNGKANTPVFLQAMQKYSREGIDLVQEEIRLAGGNEGQLVDAISPEKYGYTVRSQINTFVPEAQRVGNYENVRPYLRLTGSSLPTETSTLSRLDGAGISVFSDPALPFKGAFNRRFEVNSGERQFAIALNAEESLQIFRIDPVTGQRGVSSVLEHEAEHAFSAIRVRDGNPENFDGVRYGISYRGSDPGLRNFRNLEGAYSNGFSLEEIQAHLIEVQVHAQRLANQTANAPAEEVALAQQKLATARSQVENMVQAYRQYSDELVNYAQTNSLAVNSDGVAVIGANHREIDLLRVDIQIPIPPQFRDNPQEYVVSHFTRMDSRINEILQELGNL